MKQLPALTLGMSAAVALCGCATDTPRVDTALGKSVAAMVQAQTLHPEAAARTSAGAAVGDGPRLKNALDAFRKDVSSGTQEVQKSETFDVGKTSQ